MSIRAVADPDGVPIPAPMNASGRPASPAIVVPIAAADAGTLAARARAAQAAGADLVEIRFDTCAAQGGDPHALVEAIPTLALPVLATLRHRDEGGSWAGSPAERVRLYRRADDLGAAYVDCELAHAAALGWCPTRAKLILSHHDFTKPPADPEGIVAACYAAGAQVAKIAFMPRDAHDLAICERLHRWERRPLVVLAMGEFGLPSRLLAGVWGSHLTFARLADDAGSAPGQPTVADLLHGCRLREQGAATRLFGVIGDPIGHSRSPAMHNPALAAAGLDAVYVPLRVTDPEAFWAACGHWFAGLSITIPHKEAWLGRMDRLHPLARTIGAMNTMARDADGTTEGMNTDALAIVDSLRAAGADPAGRRVLVLGAGGAARAAAAACAAVGATVTVVNRTAERAERLARELGVRSVPWADAPGLAWDILINGTSVGLKSPDDTPWPHPFPTGAVVFDTVYVPLRTRLVRDAEAAGCRTVLGIEMFVRQGAAQFTRWTGLPAPVDLMRERVLATL
jgi:3-dehydroquinate dehydratase/shikimate dehydrogenase